MSNHPKRVALVTSGTQNIGRGIVQALAASGFDLAIHGNQEAAHEAGFLAALEQRGTKIHCCQGDVSCPNERKAIIDAVRAAFGRLDVFVNHVVVESRSGADIFDTTEQDFDSALNLHLKGPYFLTQLVARWMIGQHEIDPSFRGVIVNLATARTRRTSFDRGEYCICKAGLAMSTQLWAHRLGDSGIAVYEVRAGLIRIDLDPTIAEQYDRLIADGLTVEKRWGLPEDVGRAVAMLARGDISYATGNVLRIDGGLTLRRL